MRETVERSCVFSNCEIDNGARVPEYFSRPIYMGEWRMD